MNLKLDNKLVRFVLVGVINTAFGTGLYCLFIYLGLSYKLSVLLSTILGVLFNFKTIGTFVFKNKDNRLIIRFICSYVIVYFMNIVFIRLLLQIDFINEYIAGIVVTPIAAVISFILQKKICFKKENK